MERKEALKVIEQKLNEGIPKHVIYKELLREVPYKEDLLSYMAQIPDPEVRKKFRGANIALLVVLSSLFCWQLFWSFLIYQNTKSEHIFWLVAGGYGFTLIPLFLIFIIIDVWRFRISGYRFVFIYALFAIVMSSDLVKNVGHWLIANSPWFIATLLSYYVMKRVFPYDHPFRALDRERLEKDLSALPVQSAGLKE